MTAKQHPRPTRTRSGFNAHTLSVFGANQHNLRNVDVHLPKGSLVVFSGVSGSGKSSLAFDTLYAEGQRRYVESLSAYARQFLGQMDKPIYDRISGLSPTIAIDQKTASNNPRSTVGTITEIYDHMRVLFARAGVQHCYKCGRVVGTQDPAQIVADILNLPENTRLLVLAPIARNRKGTFADVFEAALKSGFVRARINGEVVAITADLTLDKKRKHNVDLVVDRIVVREKDRLRLTDSVETALKEGKGRVAVATVVRPGEEGETVEKNYSEARHCDHCNIGYPELSPPAFSFNTPVGACPTCNGLGIALEVDPDLVVPDKTLSVSQGCIVPWAKQVDQESWTRRRLEALEREYGVALDTPWKDLPEASQKLLLYGADKRVKVHYKGKRGSGTWEMRHEGVVPETQRRWRETGSPRMRAYYASFFAERRCSHCDGTRIRPESAAVRVGDKRIHELSHMPVRDLSTWFQDLQLIGNRATIAAELVKEIRARLGFLCDVGLEYLSLQRGGQTLSGGESQRIRLASQVGSELTGVLYILDEPSIGLHPRDNARLLRTLCHLRDLGNSVLVVEHDRETIEAADHVVDFGPGAGRLGGEVVYSGDVAGLLACEKSLTGQYLSGARVIGVPEKRRKSRRYLRVKGAEHNNLQSVDAKVPVGCFTVVTGVSGAGKSSLISGVLLPALLRELHKSQREVGKHTSIKGIDHFDKVIEIDQKPIGRTPRSNPATYTQLWGGIRDIFASLPDAKVAGYAAGRFSFNVKGGRCEHCKGDGVLKIEMHFLADVYVPCDVCGGRRFNSATLEVKYKGHSIADVLDMTIEEAVDVFRNHPKLHRILVTLERVGLGYLQLGQKAPTLSGGEAQRVKLAKELARPGTGRTLYVLDEPSTGLHFEDVRRLLAVLQELVDRGNTVLVVEHDLDIIKVADHVIDLGPDGGDAGGRIIAVGTPDAIAKVDESHTGRALRDVLT